MNESGHSVRNIFAAALEISDAEKRAAYLNRACGTNADLRREVEELLQAEADAGKFLPDQPAAAASRSALRELADAAEFSSISSAPISEKPGDRIGRYKLLQQIGEGGCGVVYMAEQEEPVRRRVALKVIKLGMDTRQVIARFEAERQALAMMDHPNIAKVLDAGATDTGRPYFVMELVRGVKITEYCDEHKLSTRERLDLFIQVCQAVQHAHQKGIIHRDLKPSNILVTVADGVRVPKVIDFGIAKATQGKLTDKTLFTAFEQFVGTPAYMSPEQAAMTILDIDTRSDIYSLGVLLYELLTGTTPFDTKELLALGVDVMRRTIREREPARPSTRLSTLHEGELTTTAQRRRTDTPKLVHQLRGDLDWIVMKCLEKDRTRRYETANGLVRDIERHLDNEPIVARPPSQLYRFGRLVRRHKTVFAAAAIVFVALVAALGISIWTLAKEKEARQRAVAAERSAENSRASEAELRQQAEAGEKKAQVEAAKSGQISQFLQDMLQGINPEVAQGRDTTLMREILDNTASRVGNELTNQPEVEAEIRDTIGRVYNGIGEYSKAQDMFRQVANIRKEHFGPNDSAAAEALDHLASALWDEGKSAEAEAPCREALTIRTKLYGSEHVSVAQSLGTLAKIFRRTGRQTEAEGLFREALRIMRKEAGEESFETVRLLTNLSGLQAQEGKFEEAESSVRQALAILKNIEAANPQTKFTIQTYMLASVLAAERKFAEAEIYFREVVAVRRQIMGNDHPYTATALSSLGTMLRRQGKFADAEQLYRECLAFRERTVPDAWYTHYTRYMLGDALLGQKRYAEAEPLLLSGYEGMKQREDKIPDPVVWPEVMGSQVQLYEATNRPEQAAGWKAKLEAFNKIVR